MKKNIFNNLKKSEKKIILNLYKSESKKILEEQTSDEKVYSTDGDPYEYKLDNGTWYYKKKNTTTNTQTGQEQNKEDTTKSNVDKNNLDSLINAVTDNPNIAKFMKQQTTQEGKWKTGTLNYDHNNPANMLPDESSKRIDPNLTVTDRSKYAKFSTPELGFKAYLNKILRWAKGGMPAYEASTKMIMDPQYNKGNKHTAYIKGQVPTLAQFIYQWAPPNSNDSEGYIKYMLKSFPGKTSETPMTEILGI